MIEPLICCENPSVETIQYALQKSYQILELYKTIIDSYVLDFFTCSHWNNLPKSWRSFFVNISPENLQILLDIDKLSICRQDVMPLEIMCLKVLIKRLSIPRNKFNMKKSSNNCNIGTVCPNNNTQLFVNNKIEKIFWKHIKMKKKHEIKLFAETVYESAKRTNCYHVIDIGSGVGHLSRLLAYEYGLKVCSIECDEKLSLQAKKLDKEFENWTSLYSKEFLNFKLMPIHLNYKIKPEMSVDEFEKVITSAFKENVSFGIIGLHPCGDLGPTLLKLYKSSSNIKFINVVGCCYMKMNMDIKQGSINYPLSKFALQNKFDLPYNSREIACHAIESYMEKLKSEHWRLKVHSYRATIEKLIIQKDPLLKHSPLANVKYQQNMTFSDYCQQALRKCDIELNDDDINSEEIKKHLSEWQLVVTFYSIRLLFAPLIESVILLDRYLYLQKETDGICRLIIGFDPKLSPRNHVLLGMKSDTLHQ